MRAPRCNWNGCSNARRPGAWNETDFFVRTADEWRILIAANPFPKEAKTDPSHLVAFIVKDEIGQKDVKGAAGGDHRT